MKLIIAALVLAVLAVAGCSSSGTDASLPGASYSEVAVPASSSFVPDGNTRCGQWLTLVSPVQRVHLAQVMTTALHAYDRSRAFAARFARNITRICNSSPANARLDEVAGGLATLDTADFP